MMVQKYMCPVCGSGEAVYEYPPNYLYEHIGLSNVILSGSGVSITKCPDCKEDTTLVSDEQQLLQFLGLVLLMAPPGMRGEELRYLRNLLGMTQADFANALGVPRRATIADWEAKDRIFASPFSEIAPRLVLLNLFKTCVLDSEYCFLTKNHRSSYNDFITSFVDRAPKMLIQKKGLRTMNIRRQHKLKEWEGELLAG